MMQFQNIISLQKDFKLFKFYTNRFIRVNYNDSSYEIEKCKQPYLNEYTFLNFF